MQRKNLFSTNHKIKPINKLDDKLEKLLMYGFIDPFSKIIGCREKTFSLQTTK
jgi:hypothetical protein